MLDRERLARNGPALALLLSLVFLALSLASYNPADPPGRDSEPVNAAVANPCGPVGAALAHALFQVLGWSSWLLLAGLGAADLLWFARRSVSEPGHRLVGFALMIAV